jgi:hypothetical protein
MRIAGAFTQGQKPQAVSLVSGQVFYPPAGNYIVSLGAVSAVQVFDPQCLVWRNFVAIPGQFVPFDSDGINWRICNVSGTVNTPNITAAGSGGPNGINPAGAAVTIAAGPTGNNALAYPIVGGALGGGITVTAAGSGFAIAPVIMIDPPPVGGIQATATCTIAAGAIATATIVNAGAGYTATPNIYVLPQYQLNPSVPLPPGSAPPTSIIPPGTVGLPPPPVNYFAPTGVVLVSGGALLNFTSATPLAASSGTLTGIVLYAAGGGYSGVNAWTVTGVGAATAATGTYNAAAIATDTTFLWPAINE